MLLDGGSSKEYVPKEGDFRIITNGSKFKIQQLRKGYAPKWCRISSYKLDWFTYVGITKMLMDREVVSYSFDAKYKHGIEFPSMADALEKLKEIKVIESRPVKNNNWRECWREGVTIIEL